MQLDERLAGGARAAARCCDRLVPRSFGDADLAGVAREPGVRAQAPCDPADDLGLGYLGREAR